MNAEEKILKLLKNTLLTDYVIAEMTDGRLYPANIYRYRKRLSEESDAVKVCEGMKKKTEKILLEIAEEVERIQPETKREAKEMVKTYITVQREKQRNELWRRN